MKLEDLNFENMTVIGYYQGDDFIHHNEGEPAVIYSDGTKYWYIHGVLHREDGPTVEWADGYKFWYLEGKRVEEENFEEAVKIYKASKICK
jgi:hypothetical protein